MQQTSQIAKTETSARVISRESYLEKSPAKASMYYKCNICCSPPHKQEVQIVCCRHGWQAPAAGLACIQMQICLQDTEVLTLFANVSNTEDVKRFASVKAAWTMELSKASGAFSYAVLTSMGKHTASGGSKQDT